MHKRLSAILMPDASFQLEWIETDEKPDKSSAMLQKEIFSRFENSSYSWLLFLGFGDKTLSLPPSLYFWRNFAGCFAGKLIKIPDIENLRDRVLIDPEKEETDAFLDSAPLMAGAEYLNTELLEAIWRRLNEAFSESVKKWEGSIAEFIRVYNPDVHLVGRIFFHLVENKDDEHPFAFLATYSTRLNQKGQSKHLPLKYALTEYKDDDEKLLDLLATVHLAAAESSLLTELLDTGELFHPVAWTREKAYLFLKEIPQYEESGILCRIPDWWKQRSANVGVSINIGEKTPSYVGMDAILSFNTKLHLGDMQLSEKEVRGLLQETEGLAFIKNKWIAVDHEKLRQVLKAYENVEKILSRKDLSIMDALRLQLKPEKSLGIEAEGIECSISHGKWFQSVIDKLQNPSNISSVKPGKGFNAKLRKYQQKGLDWLSFLDKLCFGACLADDMGLGKTVQLLAFLNLLKTKSRKQKPKSGVSLLIIPASLISNWSAEIQRFAPDLEYYVAHPGSNPDIEKNSDDNFQPEAFDLVITTYSMVYRLETFSKYEWNYIILDEAQAIKNPGTKQTKAIKKLISKNRIAMTGTPIENRISDLWSLFDFLNPGLLGSPQEFKVFSKKLSKDQKGYQKLRRLIRPYILRRLKTDKNVISDLPDKIEMKTLTPLSKKQILLYQQLTSDIVKRIETTDGIQRKGIILSALMKFKQICNHPDQYLGTEGYEEKHSGKFTRLREICETISEKREKVLVFTQFKEITEPLSRFLEGIFDRKGMVLHGSVPVARRKKIIEVFQSPSYVPFMVLSLKAGGVGLNLTEASHVIHFDRWWNPAVENQATDRAFRIGQKKNVVVHKFITKGTIEEKIDLMLEEKLKVSNDVIAPSGENLITEMKTDDLLALFNLTF
ncbi:MAG: DEAD/DEAH box helicase [Desulfobacterales bacterium]|nr:DEAD/DEAH box helicase [Desulfobacterales bacterium]